MEFQIGTKEIQTPDFIKPKNKKNILEYIKEKRRRTAQANLVVALGKHSKSQEEESATQVSKQLQNLANSQVPDSIDSKSLFYK